ncbi:MAG: hypothetical protein KDC90_19705, partial [Ignavibacteriae bacterium]|nr:hypothetical protein [Ignavibacteriota bacterium]
MAGWILINSKQDFLIESKINELKLSLNKINSELSVSHTKLNNFNHLILWSFRSDNYYPDTIIKPISESSEKYFIHGSPKFPKEFRVNAKNISESLTSLNGSFCFVLPQNDSILIAVDRIASQPVWFNFDNGLWIAANHTSVISLLKSERIEIDKVSLYTFFSTSRHFGKYGLFKNFINLNGGEYVELKLSNPVPNIKKWFSFCYKPNLKLSKAKLADKISEQLETSSSRILENSEFTYLFLSGGMDSRVAAAALGNRVNGITISTVYNMNSKVAEKVANATGIDHSIIYRDPHWYLDSFKEAAFISGGNFNLAQAHFIPAIKKTIKNHPKAVFILGDMIENYNKHYFKEATRLDENLDVSDKINQIFSYSHPDFDRLDKLFNPDFITLVKKQNKLRISETFKQAEKVSNEKSDQ